MGEVRSELGKVAWPSRPDVINYSLVALFTAIVLTFLIAALDWILSITVLELVRQR